MPFLPTTRRILTVSPGTPRRILSAAAHAAASLGEGVALFALAPAHVARGDFRWARAVEQYYGFAARSAILVGVAAFFVGMVLTLQISIELKRFGIEIYAANINCVSILRELGPILTALLVAGRCGSGIAAEIGTMSVTEQIHAMRMLGLDPVRHLVVPRWIGCVLAGFTLTILFDAVSLAGGVFVAVGQLRLTAAEYVQQVLDAIKGRDLWVGLIKASVFGAVIAVVGCLYGLKVREGALGVGQYTRRAVVTSSLLILVLDFFLTKVLLAAFGYFG